jgi:hypothetical protein
MSLDGSWLLGIIIATAVLALRWQGNSWGRVIGMVALLVAASGLAVLLLVAGLRIVS